MTDQQSPRETTQDVFRLLLDTYRNDRMEHVNRLWAGPVKDHARDHLNADVIGWLTRYEAAKKREGQA